MSRGRHRARETALQFLYRNEAPPPETEIDHVRLSEDLKAHFDHFETPEESREFAGLLVAGTLEKLSEIDSALQKHTAEGWKMDRLSAIDRSLLRMGAYEILFLEEVPATVAINEAINLAKDFGSKESPKFINGILDSISKNNSPQ